MLQLSKGILTFIVFGLAVSCASLTFTPVKTAEGAPGWEVHCPAWNDRAACYQNIKDFCHSNFRVFSEINNASGPSYIITCHDYHR